MQRRLPYLSFSALLAFATGCDLPLDGGSRGDLGAGSFNYDCVATGDAVCNRTGAVDANHTEIVLGISREVPLLVAVGGRFDLSFRPDGGSAAFVEPARRRGVSVQGGFSISDPGVHAFLARTRDGEVADFIHVEARRIAELEIWSEGVPISGVSLAVGERLTIAALPVDHQHTPLAGGSSWHWSNPQTGEVELEAAPGPFDGAAQLDDEVVIVGLAEGTTTVAVQRGDATAEIPIEVTPAEEVTP